MREWLSLAVWAGAFFLFELPAYDLGGPWPWYTLSETVQRGVVWWWPIALYVVSFMLVLAGHFIFEWNVKWVLLVAALGVALITSHLLKFV